MTERLLLTEADRLFDLKEYASALDAYETAYALNSENIEVRTGIALSLFYLGKYRDAIPYLVELLNYLPNSEQLSIILAETLRQSGRPADAIDHLEKLVERSPSNMEARARLGRLYLDNEKYPEANSCFEKVLDKEPCNVEVLGYMGLMMIKFCQFDNALAVLNKAHALAPEDVLVLNNLGRACKMMGRHDNALKWYRKALEIDRDNVCVIGNYLFALNYCPDLTPEYISGEHFRLAPLYAPRNAPATPEFDISPASDRLRVGYVSGDFYTHSVTYFLEPVLQNHDYRRFEVYCYSLGSTKDATTERLKGLPCIWRDMIGVPPEALAKIVREDRIDILVDLSGHTAENRLGAFAIRSAPVQASWIGYPSTSGLPQMDYYITDNACDPPGMTEHLYSEKLYRLPKVFSCYLPPMEFPLITPPPCLENGFVTFGSFNNFGKVNGKLLELWAAILSRVPGSHLYLKSMALGDKSTQDPIFARFKAHGIDRDRIHMRTVTMTPPEHLQEYAKVDIALDTFPYNGTTTTCEALWQGVPVVTLAGASHVSRVGLSLLECIGHQDFTACTPEEYVAVAVGLARDQDRLSALREQLRWKIASSPLMDGIGLTRDLERGYEDMYRNYSELRKRA